MAQDIDYVIKVDDSQAIAAWNRNIENAKKLQAEAVKTGNDVSENIKKQLEDISKTATTSAAALEKANKGIVDGQKDVSEAVTETTKKTSLLTKAKEKLSKAYQTIKTKVTEYLDANKKAGSEFKQAVVDYAKGKSTLSELGESFLNVSRAAVGLGTSSAQSAKQVEATGKAATGASKAFKLATGAAKLFKYALIATGIGAIIALVVTLVSKMYDFTKSVSAASGGLNLIASAINIVNAALIVGKQRLEGFVEGLLLFITISKEAGIQKMADAFKGLGKEVAAAAVELNEIKKATEDLENALNALDIEESKRIDTIAKLREASGDETKSIGARVSAIKKAAKEEEYIDTRRLKLARERLRIAEQEEMLYKGQEGTQDEVVAALIDLNNLEAKVNARRRADQREINNLYRESLEKIKAMRDEYNSLLKDLQDRANQAEINLLPDFSAAIKQKDLALKEVDDFYAQIKKTFDELSKLDPTIKLPENFDVNFDLLKADIEKEFVDMVDKLKEDDRIRLSFQKFIQRSVSGVEITTELPSAGLAKSLERFSKDEEDALNRVAYSADIARINLREKLPAFEQIKQDILSALKISEEEAGLLFNALGGALGSFVDSQLLIAEAKLEYLNKVVSYYDQEIDALKGKIEEERRLQEQGYANNLALYEENLKSAQEKRDEADKAALEQQKKIARQQIAVNAAQQASEYVLTIARLISNQAKFGIIGLIAGIGALSIVGRILAQAKANALKFAEPPKFKEGGQVNGLPHWLGGKKIEVEGGEFIVRQKYVTKETIPILKAINAGDIPRIKGLDLSPLVKAMKEAPAPTGDVVINQSNKVPVMEAAEMIINYLETRPVKRLNGEGKEVITWKQGGNQFSQIVE